MFAVDDSWDEPSTEAPAIEPSAQDDTAIEMLLDKCDLLGVLPPMPKKAGAPPASVAMDDAGASTAAPKIAGVELGYVEPWLEDWGPPTPEQFPSKVGGTPVWLEPEHLPSAASMCCGVCGKKLRFLMQLYCPRWPQHQHAYHRSVLLFCCGGACLLEPRGWKALRCNLAESTPYYALQDGVWKSLVTAEAGVHAAGGSTLAAAAGGGDVASSNAMMAEALVSRDLIAPELWVSTCLEGDWQAALAWWDAGTSDKAHAEHLLQQYRQGQAEAAAAADDSVAAEAFSDPTLSLDERMRLVCLRSRGSLPSCRPDPPLDHQPRHPAR